MLGGILTVSATQSAGSGAIALLAFYAAGLGVPFLLAAFFMHELTARLKTLRRAGRLLHVGAGVVMIIIGCGDGDRPAHGFRVLAPEHFSGAGANWIGEGAPRLLTPTQRNGPTRK